MKRIINGKRYDTETARKVADYWHGSSSRDFTHYEESLYCKRTGEYFLAGEGGLMTAYAKSVSQNTTSGGSAIFPLDDSAARIWAEAHMDVDAFEVEFGQVEIDTSSNVGANIRAAREAAGMTQAQLAAQLGIGQARIAEWESGATDPRATSLVAIIKALGADPGDLLK